MHAFMEKSDKNIDGLAMFHNGKTGVCVHDIKLSSCFQSVSKTFRPDWI